MTSSSRTSLTSPWRARRPGSGGAHGDDLVGVDAPVRLTTGQALDELLHRRHAGGAADRDHVVDLVMEIPAS